MTHFASLSAPTKGALVAGAALAGLLVWAALAMAIALLGLHRWSAHLDPLRVPGWFLWFRKDPFVLRWLKIGAVASGAAMGAPIVALASKLKRPLFGSARFAREGEIRREELRASEGVLLGSKGGRLLSFGGTEHVLLYAPTRSGKGVGVVIPNLLSWPGSAVVLDIKRENWAATSGFRAAHGQAVHLFDPLAPDGATARFNPLTHIPRGDCTAVLDELQKIAAMLFPQDGSRSDPFWAEAARTGFVGVGAYVAETPALPFTLGQIFRELTQGSPKIRFPDLIVQRDRSGRSLSPGCVSALTDFCSASDNTFASIRQTITARMGLWLNPRVDAATSASDFDLRNLRDEQTTIYLATSPDNVVRVAPLYNLLFQQLADLNTRVLPAPHTSGRVLLLLDEFARLGAAPVLAHGFSFMAGYGLRILAVLQSPSQLRSVYGPDLAQEIVSNCGVEIAFTPKELAIAKDLSERLGYDTVEGRSRSRPLGLGAGKRSVTESDQRRALLLPQELMQLPKDHLLVLRAGVPPVLGRKLVYWKDRAFAARVLPPPEVPPLRQGATATNLHVLAVDVAGIRTDVETNSGRLVERAMTEAEAAGEVALSNLQVSLALEDVDMNDLPSGHLEDDEVLAILRAYAERASQSPDRHAIGEEGCGQQSAVPA